MQKGNAKHPARAETRVPLRPGLKRASAHGSLRSGRHWLNDDKGLWLWLSARLPYFSSFSLSFSALPQEVEAEGEVLSVSDFNAATDSVSLDEPPTDGASPSKGTEI
jgi:hypothetical protein